MPRFNIGDRVRSKRSGQIYTKNGWGYRFIESPCPFPEYDLEPYSGIEFTTPCFVKKNTPEIQKRLKELGYELSNSVRSKMTGEIYCYLGYCYAYCPIGCHSPFDCGENEDLFFAIAALREESDKFQWFIDDLGNWEMSRSDVWMNGHKATFGEILMKYDN